MRSVVLALATLTLWSPMAYSQERPADHVMLESLYDAYLFGLWCQERGESFNDVNLGIIEAAGAKLSSRMDDEFARETIYARSLRNLPIGTDRAISFGIQRECRNRAGEIIRQIHQIDDLTFPSKPPF